MPVSSYAPEFLEIFRRGAQEEVRITLTDAKMAHRLRFRLNNLRRDLRKEQHPLATVSNGVTLRVDGPILLIEPSDDDFLAAIQEAGITINSPLPYTPLSADDTPKAAAPAPDHSDIMKHFKKE